MSGGPDPSQNTSARVTCRFVLLSYARSGTSTLIRGIGQHSDCYAHREIFHRAWERAILPETHAALDLAPLRATPLEYARAVLGYSPGPSCVGFKMMFGQDMKACIGLMQDPSVHKIILERRNALAGFSSMLTARQTGIFHAPNPKIMARQTALRQPLRFDREAFERHVARSNWFFREYRRHSTGPVLEVSYAELSPLLLDRLQGFLGLSPEALDLPLPKMGDGDILGRFATEDHPAIRTALDELGHPEWTTEALGSAV